MRKYLIPLLLLGFLGLVAVYALNKRPHLQPSFVEVSPSFWVSRYEITAEQFANFLNASDYHFPESDQLIFTNKIYSVSSGMKFLPVYSVSRVDAKAYAAWLSLERGEEVRLLTENEWLLAAEGGLENPDFAYGWGPDRSAKEIIDVRKCIPNKVGLYGMTGNVAEWVLSPKGKPFAMGGSWAELSAEKLNLKKPQLFPAGYADKDVGFRVCLATNQGGMTPVQKVISTK